MQLYAVLRGAVFAESGFNLEFSKIVPDGLKRDSNANFATMDADGKIVRMDRIGGTEGNGDDLIAIPLKPYARPELAVAALVTISSNLTDAIAGDEAAQTALGKAWGELLFSGLEIKSQDGKTQLAILENAYGWARVHEQLNHYGTAAGLGEPGTPALVAEALNLQ